MFCGDVRTRGLRVFVGAGVLELATSGVASGFVGLAIFGDRGAVWCGGVG